MTESARREANRCNGLEGHNCCRLSRRRSDLFHRHALAFGSSWVRGAIVYVIWRYYTVGVGIAYGVA